MGLRYFIQRAIVPGTKRKVDVVFSRQRVAVDVRGCFWHGHGHSGVSATNSEYWSKKIKANIDRDLDTEARLRAAGWRVVVVWECEDPLSAAQRVALALGTREVR